MTSLRGLSATLKLSHASQRVSTDGLPVNREPSCTFLEADFSLLIVTQRLHCRSCTHRDPPIQIVETKQRDGSWLGARGRLGGPRQCLCVDILTDACHFAIPNGNGEDPMVLERFIRGFDFPR